MPQLTPANRLTLTTYRERRKLTLRKMAAKCGVSEAMISYVESGAKSPSTDLLHRMAEALGLVAEVQEIVRVRLKRIQTSNGRKK